jgi:hypothetical protein
LWGLLFQLQNKNRDHPGINRERVEKKIRGDQKDHMIKDQNRSTCKKIPRDHPRRSRDRHDQKALRYISIPPINHKDQYEDQSLNTQKTITIFEGWQKRTKPPNDLL